MIKISSIFAISYFSSAVLSFAAFAVLPEELMDEALGLASIGFDMAKYSTSSSTDDVVQCIDMIALELPT